MINVYLLRHGQTAWNADGNRYCGRTDIPLTEKGIQQAHLVREQLKHIQFDRIYASPLQRSFKTAEIAGGGQEVIIEPRLIEADFGNWESKTQAVFAAEDPIALANWNKDPSTARAGATGETGLEIVNRVDSFFTECVNTYPAGSNLLVVAHNGLNRLYLAHKLGMPLRNYRKLVIENSVVSLFHLDKQGELSLVHLNSRL